MVPFEFHNVQWVAFSIPEVLIFVIGAIIGCLFGVPFGMLISMGFRE